MAARFRLIFVALSFWFGSAVLVRAQSDARVDSSGPMAPGLTTARGSFRSVLRPVIDVPLSSRAAGVVDVIHLPEGSVVKAGQPIITLDADQEKAEVAQAEAAVRGAKAEVDRSVAEFERAGKLRDVNSEKQFIDARAASELAQSRYEQAVAAVRLAQVRLANRTIRSPIDGIFLKTTKLVGEAVDRYETVARVIDITSLEMTVYCDGKFFSRFQTGQRVEIRVVKNPEEQPIVTGVVVHTDPIVDPSSGTFRIKIKIDPSANSIPGLQAYLIMPG